MSRPGKLASIAETSLLARAQYPQHYQGESGLGARGGRLSMYHKQSQDFFECVEVAISVQERVIFANAEGGD